MKTTQRHRSSAHRFACLALLAGLALPTAGGAAAPSDDERRSTCATDDCAESTVTIQVDTVTGYVYAVDPATGTFTLVGNEIPIHFGGQSRVLLHLYYTVGEWEVQIASEGSPTETFETSNGSLRYFIEPDHADYVFTSTEAQQGASTSMSMAPVPPGEIIIMPDSSCPPD